MAKLKSKKAKFDFKKGLSGILEAHHLHLEPEVLEPLLSDMEQFFNETFKPDNKVAWWNEIVSQYLSYYFELTSEKAAFNPIQAVALKKLSKLLMERYLAANKDAVWDVQACLGQHKIFYDAVCTLDFYKRSFTVAMCYNQFDTIKSQLSAKRNKQKEIDDKILAD